MDRYEKLMRMEKHLEEHPHDYQTVISVLKTRSDIYAHRNDKRRVERIKHLLEIRKQLEEEDKWHETNYQK